MKVELWALERIIPYARNPRNNEEAVAGVAASIKEFGPRQCIVVDKDGVIIAGHTRLKAAQRLGMAEFPVHVAEGLTKAQIKAYRLADNKVAEKATWDVEMLKVELDDLAGMNFDMDVMGFDSDAINSQSDVSELEHDTQEVDVDSIQCAKRCPRCGFEFDKEV